MDAKVSYLLTDEGWIEQRPLFLDSDGEEKAKDSDGEKKAKDSDGEKEVKDSDGEKKAKDSDGEEKAKDSDGEKEVKDSDGEKKAKDSDEEKAKDSDGEEEVKDSDGEKKAKDSDGEEEVKDSDEETIDCGFEIFEDSIVKDMMKAVDSSNLRKPFVHPSKRLTSRSYVRKVMSLNSEHVPVEFENITLDSMNSLTASTILDSMLRSAGVIVEEVEQDYTRTPKKDFNF